MGAEILNQIYFAPSVPNDQPFSVGCEVFKPAPYGLEGPHNLVVEYLGGTMRLSISSWLELEKHARLALNLSFQQVRGKTLDETIAADKLRREAEEAVRAVRPHQPVSGLYLANAIALAQANPNKVGFVHDSSDSVHKWNPRVEEVVWRRRAKGSIWRRADWCTAQITSKKWKTVPLVDGEIPT